MSDLKQLLQEEIDRVCSIFERHGEQKLSLLFRRKTARLTYSRAIFPRCGCVIRRRRCTSICR